MPGDLSGRSLLPPRGAAVEVVHLNGASKRSGTYSRSTTSTELVNGPSASRRPRQLALVTFTRRDWNTAAFWYKQVCLPSLDSPSSTRLQIVSLARRHAPAGCAQKTDVPGQC